MQNLGIEFPEQGVARLVDLGVPPASSSREILIGTQYSGVTNGTERHAMMGEFDWNSYPGRHGYQHVGVVEKAGSDVSEFQEGDRLFFGRYVGHRGWHVQDVGDAEMKSYGSHLCLPLPADVDAALCVLFGVAGVAMRAVRRCRVADGHHVWVVGAGLIGQFAAQSARAFGANVTITDVIDKRLEIAEKIGANRVLNAADPQVYEALQEGGPYDRIIDASGYSQLFADVCEHNLLAYRGVIGAIAVRGEIVFPWRMLHGREASIKVSCHFSLDDLQVVLHFVRRGTIQIEPLVLHRAPIAEAPKLYEMLRARREEMLGIIFQWED